MPAVQEFRQPVEKEPPDRVRHEFGDEEGPGLAVRQQARPGYFGDGLGGVALNIVKLGLPEAWVLGGTAVNPEPDYQPRRAEEAGKQESPLPAESDCNP